MPDLNPTDTRNEPSPSYQRLHAYWRMPYILAPRDEKECGNPFAQIPKTDDDRKEYILCRGEKNYILMNRYPYNAGHLLVLPYREVETLDAMEPDERHELIDLIVKAQDILNRALQPDGFNTGFNFGQAAGAGIPTHLHCHIVPRWEGDTNFMPVISHTRVLPDALDTMWERLRAFVD
ncbi:MAG: HIT family protein [Opitutales bacterium]